MYETYWELREKPFENTPDPRFIYYSPAHQQVLLNLMYILSQNKGAALLTGDYGCGKTLLTRTLISRLSSDEYEVALLTNPRWSVDEFLVEILYQFGVEGDFQKKREIIHRFNGVLYENAQKEKKTILMIDEAQLIESDAVFEEVRLLLNFQLNDRFLLTLILIGQPELRQMVKDIPQLDQRIGIKCHLGPLKPHEIGEYIRHRLSVVGRSDQIFMDDAITMIAKHTGGTPRRINHICDICLLVGFSRQLRRIDREVVEGLITAEGGER
ncbi:MAG: AAA family ATPase [Candidatus Latescibacteria bacterium]|nr:AAA family ATPase [Candidatus Latescibacterota bacterium]